MSLKYTAKRITSSIYYSLKRGKSQTLTEEGTFRILLYHSVNPEKGKDPLGLRTDPNNFYEQMSYLSQNGYQVITLEQLISYLREKISIPPKAITLTFDDGYKDMLSYVVPILYKFNFPATVFIATNYIDGKARPQDYWEDWEYLSWDELRELPEHQIAVGSHALSHRPLKELSQEEVEAELRHSKARLEEMITEPISLFSYPHGSVNKAIKDEVKKSGYLGACSSRIGLNDSHSDIFALRRTEIVAQDTIFEFKKKVIGFYDWLDYLKQDKE